MKLDKIKFAQLVAMITAEYNHMRNDFVQALDDLVDFNIPDVATDKVNPSRVDDILKAMQEDRKIDAIKAYRSLTGSGLKESKDAIEAHWDRKARPPVNFDKFEG